MWTFENIGFSHAVDDIKLLTCADCEHESIGFTLVQNTQVLWLSTTRVKYV